MTEIFTPLSLWVQLASFFFTLSGIHGDLLVIRLFLFLAYIMLFVNAVLGSPLWPEISNPAGLGLDSLIWAVIGMYVHGASLLGLILDEVAVTLGDDEEALWRMLYRTGGLSKRLYKTVVHPYVQIVCFENGETIPTDEFFYIVYRGNVHLRVFDGDHLKVDRRTIRSGEMFDMKYTGMFRKDSIFAHHRIECRALMHTVLFRFSRADMEKIVNHNFAKGVWQALLINNLSFVIESYIAHGNEHPDYRYDAVDKVFEPLAEAELPPVAAAGSGLALFRPLWHVERSIRRSFSPPWPFGRHPSGIRQTLLAAPRQIATSDPQRRHPLQHGRSTVTHPPNDPFFPDFPSTAESTEEIVFNNTQSDQPEQPTSKEDSEGGTGAEAVAAGEDVETGLEIPTEASNIARTNVTRYDSQAPTDLHTTSKESNNSNTNTTSSESLTTPPPESSRSEVATG